MRDGHACGCGALGAALLIATLVVVPHTQEFARWAALPPAAPDAKTAHEVEHLAAQFERDAAQERRALDMAHASALAEALSRGEENGAGYASIPQQAADRDDQDSTVKATAAAAACCNLAMLAERECGLSLSSCW